MSDPFEALREAVRRRPEELARRIEEGREVVGTLVPMAPPAEVIEAAGALPYRLLDTGGADAELRGMTRLGRDTCGFCRSVLGQATVTPPPVTCVAAGSACDRLRRAVDAWPGTEGLPVFLLGLPRTRGLPGEVEAVAAEFRLFGEELSRRTGIQPTEERLRTAIRDHDRCREALRELDALRREDAPRVTGLEFFDVVRAYHALPAGEFLALGEELLGWVRGRPPPVAAPVRVLLVGPTLADGRRGVLEMLEERGLAVAVADLTDSGSLGYGAEVGGSGEPWLALARATLDHSILAAPLRPATALRKRYRTALDQARADGVLFRSVPFCRPWLSEAVPFHEISTVPFLSVLEDGTTGRGQLRTRIGAFVETLLARRGAGGRP